MPTITFDVPTTVLASLVAAANELLPQRGVDAAALAALSNAAKVRRYYVEITKDVHRSRSVQTATEGVQTTITSAATQADTDNAGVS